MEILNKIFNQMSDVFSSNEFSIRCKQNGISQLQINNGIIANYLHNNAMQLSRRTWIKKSVSDMKIDNNLNKIDDAIKLLKNNGYKIMKPINDYIEV